MGRLVGLTGGIGCGKSLVAALLAEHGAAIVDADQLAREAVQPGSDGLKAVVERFGEQYLSPDGSLDRRKLGAHVFEDSAARKALNGIVHPAVAKLSAERIGAHLNAGAPLVVYDVPLLYENALDRALPEVIVVHVPPDVQRARIKARDNLSDSEIEARIAAQMPLEEKVRRADYTIDNGGTIEQTRAQVGALWKKLVEGGST